MSRSLAELIMVVNFKLNGIINEKSGFVFYCVISTTEVFVRKKSKVNMIDHYSHTFLRLHQSAEQQDAILNNMMMVMMMMVGVSLALHEEAF